MVQPLSAFGGGATRVRQATVGNHALLRDAHQKFQRGACVIILRTRIRLPTLVIGFTAVIREANSRLTDDKLNLRAQMVALGALFGFVGARIVWGTTVIVIALSLATYNGR